MHPQPPRAGGQALAQSAITAVQRVTRAAGVRLTVPRAIATAAGASGAVDVTALIALGLGLLWLLDGGLQFQGFMYAGRAAARGKHGT